MTSCTRGGRSGIVLKSLALRTSPPCSVAFAMRFVRQPCKYVVWLPHTVARLTFVVESGGAFLVALEPLRRRRVLQVQAGVSVENASCIG